MRRVSKARKFVSHARQFVLDHPVITMFLAVVAVLGFIPVFLFFSIVSGSFVVIFVTALTVFQGVVVVCLVPLLTVLVPILMIGGTVAVFVYIAYRSAVRALQIINSIIKAVLPTRFLSKPVGCGGYQVKPHGMPQEYNRHTKAEEYYDRHDSFPTDEEPFEEELSSNSFPERFDSSPSWF